MEVIIKYEILDENNLSYGAFEKNGTIIQNDAIRDRVVSLGGISSNIEWLKQDVHRLTERIKVKLCVYEDIVYKLVECEQELWFDKSDKQLD